MQSVIPDYLEEVLGNVASDATGKLARYIPELAAADPERLGAVFATVDGHVYGAGDVDAEFTIQSISKPFAYALALADAGFDAVLEKVGVEPPGEAFNRISLEEGTGRPFNPMINAGAITVHSLVRSEHPAPDERVARVVRGLSAFAGRPLAVDEAVCASEMENAHRNLAIAHMLRSHGILTEDPRIVVDGYIRQCSVLVTTRDLAMMAATLANRGVNPLTGEQVVAGRVAVVRTNHVVRSTPGEVRVLQLQGGIRFAGAERIDREVVDTAPSEPRVVFDLTMVSSIDDVARRMLLEVARRLRVQGREVYLVDPEAMITDPDAGDGGRLEVVDDLERALSLPRGAVAHNGRPEAGLDHVPGTRSRVR